MIIHRYAALVARDALSYEPLVQNGFYTDSSFKEIESYKIAIIFGLSQYISSLMLSLQWIVVTSSGWK